VTPLKPEIQKWAQTALNMPVRQGYGLTETCVAPVGKADCNKTRYTCQCYCVVRSRSSMCFVCVSKVPDAAKSPLPPLWDVMKGR